MAFLIIVCLPVGVPKIVYRLPGEEDDTWVDMYNVLYRERMLFVLQEIQEELAGQVCGVIRLGDMEDVENPEQEPVPYNAFVCSPGGSLYAGSAIYDSLKNALAPAFSWCFGLAASTATLAVLGGHLGNRFASPNARLMIHQPASSKYDGPIESCLVEANELLKMRHYISQVYQAYMGLEIWQIHLMLNHDFYLTPEVALKYNLIDEVCSGLPDDFWVSHFTSPQHTNGTVIGQENGAGRINLVPDKSIADLVEKTLAPTGPQTTDPETTETPERIPVPARQITELEPGWAFIDNAETRRNLERQEAYEKIAWTFVTTNARPPRFGSKPETSQLPYTTMVMNPTTPSVSRQLIPCQASLWLHPRRSRRYWRLQTNSLPLGSVNVNVPTWTQQLRVSLIST